MQTLLVLAHSMSIKTRFTLLLGLWLLGFVGSWLWLRQVERGEARQILARARVERMHLLNHWIDFSARALPEFAAALAESGEFKQLMSEPASPGVRAKIRDELNKAGLYAVWWFETGGALPLTVGFEGREDSAVAPLSLGELAPLTSVAPTARFYAEKGPEFLEFFVRKIEPARDGVSRWLVVARRWDEPYLASLASLTEGAVSLVSPGRGGATQEESASVVALRPLLGRVLEMNWIRI